nr:cell division protein ZapD [Shewanella sp. NIFS-20-20]
MTIIFEQPLNEKIRSYLRLEYLAEQLQLHQDNDHLHQGFFPLFSLCELTERCDYRSDVIKDIDKHLITMNQWRQLSHVDHDLVDSYVIDLTHAREGLQATERLGTQLKQDRFLAALRQRFSMPGACCNFDLPQLHFWLAKPWAERQEQYRAWCQHFMPLLKPISIMLALSRATSEFTPQIAKQGFYQEQSQLQLNLVRVRLSTELACYPTISGYRNRFAIHFVDFDSQKHTESDIPFEIAYCR